MKSSRRKSSKKKDDGQIWSSYSDMFTTIAIVFLTLFVFAMIKVGVSTMERVAQKKAHEKDLLGLNGKRKKGKKVITYTPYTITLL